MAQMNKRVSGVDTLFIPSGSSHSYLASKLIREIARFGGDCQPWSRPGRQAAGREVRGRDGRLTATTTIPSRQLRRPRRRARPGRRRRGAAAAAARADRHGPARRRCRPRSRSTATRCSTCSTRRSSACPTRCGRPAGCSRTATSSSTRTQREADDILAAARGQAERMVQRSEVMKAAEAKARRIVDNARAEAGRLRNEADDFCDKRLAQLETVLERTMTVISRAAPSCAARRRGIAALGRFRHVRWRGRRRATRARRSVLGLLRPGPPLTEAGSEPPRGSPVCRPRETTHL